jgi:hypothetical protein
MTDFDRRVAGAQADIESHTDSKPPEISTGQAAKAVCQYLATSGPAGLDDYVRSSTLHLPLLVDYGTPGNYQQTVADMVENVCPGYAQLLGPEWHTR